MDIVGLVVLVVLATFFTWNRIDEAKEEILETIKKERR